MLEGVEGVCNAAPLGKGIPRRGNRENKSPMVRSCFVCPGKSKEAKQLEQRECEKWKTVGTRLQDWVSIMRILDVTQSALGNHCRELSTEII